MAKSNLDLATVNVQQQMIDFEQQVFLDIMQFNMQSDQLMLAAKRIQYPGPVMISPNRNL
jgi:hypothetical protein